MSEPDETPRIEARATGPLVAIGARSITGSDGQALEVKPKRVLCRCGHSRNKPFCDGSHNRVGFDPSKPGTPAGRDRLIAYEGAEVTVFFNPRVCSHAGQCARLAGHIFDSRETPWVQPDKGTLDEVRAVIAACPSGALTMKGADGAPVHLVAEDRADIVVQRHGPYWVRGLEPPAEPNAEGMTRQKYVLCRCGLSGNKPFCDGSHRAAHWREDQTAD